MPSSSEVRVLDASALINLLVLDASTVRAILTSCGGRFLVPEPVQREVRRNAAHLEALSLDLLEQVELADHQLERFVDLACTMGDGEASVLACAESVNGIAVVDDSDAHVSTSSARIEWSVDLMLSPRVQRTIETNVLREAVYLAGTVGRMRFPPRSWAEAIRLLGEDGARDCPGLRRALRSPRPLRSGNS